MAFVLLAAALARPAGVLQPSSVELMQPAPSPGPAESCDSFCMLPFDCGAPACATCAGCGAASPLPARNAGYAYGNYHYGDGDAHPSPSPAAEATAAESRWADVAKRLTAQLLAATDELDGVPPSTESATFATLFPPLPMRTEKATLLLTPTRPLPPLKPSPEASPEASPSPQPAPQMMCGAGTNPDTWFPCNWAPFNDSAHPYSLPACANTACHTVNGTCREPLVGVACDGFPPSVCAQSGRGAGCTLPTKLQLLGDDILEGPAPRPALSTRLLAATDELDGVPPSTASATFSTLFPPQPTLKEVVPGAAAFLSFPAPTPEDLVKARRERAAETGTVRAERGERSS